MNRRRTPADALAAIVAFQAEHGYPPTVRELGARLGLSGIGTVVWHLDALERAGCIRRAPRRSRALTVLRETMP